MTRAILYYFAIASVLAALVLLPELVFGDRLIAGRGISLISLPHC
jgi:hypothetical protein